MAGYIGTKAVNLSTTGADIAGDLEVSGAVNAGNMVAQVAYFAVSTAPSGWLKADGTAIARTTYADLFAAVGTTFGVGDGTTTFNVPDLRGEFMRAWDDGRGIDSGRVFGSAQGDAVQDHTHDLFQYNSNLNASGWPRFLEGDPATAPRTIPGIGGGTIGTSRGVQGVKIGTGGNLGHSVTKAAETRGRNIAMLACIKF
jgi:phage-related tail fiber protein